MTPGTGLALIAVGLLVGAFLERAEEDVPSPAGRGCISVIVGVAFLVIAVAIWLGGHLQWV